MREIKFRAWDKSLKEMYLAKPLAIMFHNEHIFLHCFDFKANSLSPDITKLILMQLTGLHDKDGKEIYTGDLIIHQSRNNKKPHPVIFHKGAFCGDYGLIYPFFDENWDKYCEIEVVGNIYKNPELLND